MLYLTTSNTLDTKLIYWVPSIECTLPHKWWWVFKGLNKRNAPESHKMQISQFVFNFLEEMSLTDPTSAPRSFVHSSANEIPALELLPLCGVWTHFGIFENIFCSGMTKCRSGHQTLNWNSFGHFLCTLYNLLYTIISNKTNIRRWSNICCLSPGSIWYFVTTIRYCITIFLDDMYCIARWTAE